MRVKQKYNQDTDGFSQLEIGCQRSENLLQTEGLGPQWPTVDQPSQNAKEVLLWLEELGVNMLQSVPVSISPLTHKKHHPFENKVGHVYFYKEVCTFVHWSSSLLLTMFCLWLYTRNIRHIDIFLFISSVFFLPVVNLFLKNFFLINFF